MATSTMTAAFKKAQDYRDAMNKGRLKILAKDFSCVVYLYELNNVPIAIGYKGRAKKPAFHLRYGSTEQRAIRVQEWMAAQSEHKSNRKKSAERTLQVDDVLRCSWGYEQTNIDYYLVTKLIGKSMVELVEIGQLRDGGGMTGDCVPDKSKIIGEPIRRKADGDSVKIESYSWARKIEPQMVGGIEVYSPDHWTSYH